MPKQITVTVYNFEEFNEEEQKAILKDFCKNKGISLEEAKAEIKNYSFTTENQYQSSEVDYIFPLWWNKKI